jgi:hypothetical protein
MKSMIARHQPEPAAPGCGSAPPDPPRGSRALRADAARNRDAIVAVARDVAAASARNPGEAVICLL